MSKIITGIGNKCIDVKAANSSNGTPIIIWDKHGGNNQKWIFNGDVIESFLDSTKCIDIMGEYQTLGLL
jgi:hypothetical protein